MIQNQTVFRILQGTIIVAGVAMVIVGVMREEHLTVLHKAINICLQCIGIG